MASHGFPWLPMASKVLATEACFFVTVFSCSLLRALITSGPEMAKMGGLLRFSFGLVLWQIRWGKLGDEL